MSWGWNAAGQLGLGDAYEGDDVVASPTCIGQVQSCSRQTVKLAAGRVHSIVAGVHLTASTHGGEQHAQPGLQSLSPESLRTAVVWGNGRNGRLGLGDQISVNAPQMLEIDGQVVDIACGCDHTLVLTE